MRSRALLAPAAPQPWVFDIGETCVLAIRSDDRRYAWALSVLDGKQPFAAHRKMARCVVGVVGYDTAMPALRDTVDLLLALRQPASDVPSLIPRPDENGQLLCHARVVSHDLRRRNPANVIITGVYEGPR